MFAASLHHSVRPVSVLLGGSGTRRTAERKQPDVAALLKPRIDLAEARSRPADAVVPPWEVDSHDRDRGRAPAIAIVMATDAPTLVPETMCMLK